VLSEPSVVSTLLKKLQDTAVVTESCALLARKRRCLRATRRRPRLSTERARKPSALAFALPPRILYALRALACVGPGYTSSTSILSAQPGVVAHARPAPRRSHRHASQQSAHCRCAAASIHRLGCRRVLGVEQPGAAHAVVAARSTTTSHA
jgi:hypothetical protein